MAQGDAALRIAEGGYGLVKTNISVTYDHTWNRVREGFNARVSYEFLKTRHLTLSGNFRHSSVTTDFLSSDTDKDYNTEVINLNGTHTMEQLGVTATANTTLCGRYLMGIGMINSEWGKGGFNRLSATVMAMLMLRTNRSTQFGIGILGMINTTSKVPVFPVFVYRHKFNDRWLINLYGAMCGLDYTPTKKDLISVGADVNVKSFYFRPHAEGLPKTCRYTQTNFRPMLKYRRVLLPHLYFELQGGVAVNMSSRVNGVNGTKEYFRLSQKSRPFIQVSASYSM